MGSVRADTFTCSLRFLELRRKMWSHALPSPQILELICAGMNPNLKYYFWPKSYCREERLYLGGFRLARWESSQVFNDTYCKIGLIGGQGNFKSPQQFIDFRNDAICLSYSELVFLEDYGAKLNFQKCESFVITGTDIVQNSEVLRSCFLHYATRPIGCF